MIPKQPNRDWRTESRKRKISQRGDVGGNDGDSLRSNAASERKPNNGKDEAGEMKFGLQILHERKDIELTPVEANPETVKPQVQLTDDQVAIQALLGNNPNGNSNVSIITPEDAAFKTDYASAPDVATLDEYLSVPVEEFGAALLRGMGWREGETPGRRRHQQHQQNSNKAGPRQNAKKQPNAPKERRAALLGIGAKEEAAVGVELGAWGGGRQAKDAAKKAKGRKLVDQVYNPVLLRNKVTGEQLTEEELKLKLEQQKMEFLRQGKGEREDKDEDRYTRRKGNGRDRDRDRYREKERDRDRNRDRNRSRDRDRDRDRDKDKDRDGDGDRARRERTERDKYKNEDDHVRDKRSDRDRKNYRREIDDNARSSGDIYSRERQRDEDRGNPRRERDRFKNPDRDRRKIIHDGYEHDARSKYKNRALPKSIMEYKNGSNASGARYWK